MSPDGGGVGPDELLDTGWGTRRRIGTSQNSNDVTDTGLKLDLES